MAKRVRPKCRIDGCAANKQFGNGLCKGHGDNLTLRGDPLVHSELYLACRAVAKLWTLLRSPAAYEPGECWEWPGKARGPTGHVPSRRNGGAAAHRAAWVEAYGPVPDGLWVLHKCDNPPCCRPSHLYLGDRSQNVRDAYERGQIVQPRGEKRSNTRLSDASVREIRLRYAGGETQRSIAESFSINNGYVSRICAGKYRADA
jgi:HNH endonuclease